MELFVFLHFLKKNCPLALNLATFPTNYAVHVNQDVNRKMYESDS